MKVTIILEDDGVPFGQELTRTFGADEEMIYGRDWNVLIVDMMDSLKEIKKPF